MKLFKILVNFYKTNPMTAERDSSNLFNYYLHLIIDQGKDGQLELSGDSGKKIVLEKGQDSGGNNIIIVSGGGADYQIVYTNGKVESPQSK